MKKSVLRQENKKQQDSTFIRLLAYQKLVERNINRKRDINQNARRG